MIEEVKTILFLQDHPNEGAVNPGVGIRAHAGVVFLASGEPVLTKTCV